MSTVLIIEDAQVVRSAIRDILSSEWPDLRLIECGNGAEGIERAVLEKPDLILMDGNLPIMTGNQMAHLFKMMPSVAAVPLVAITGADPNNPMVMGMRQICDAYLPKPFGADELIETVKSFLNLVDESPQFEYRQFHS
jgi:DNA-binding response OmpR family regulator